MKVEGISLIDNSVAGPEEGLNTLIKGMIFFLWPHVWLFPFPLNSKTYAEIQQCMEQCLSTIIIVNVSDRGSLHGVVINMLDCDIEVSQFELQFRYNVHFWTNTLKISLNSLKRHVWVKYY